MNFFCLQLAVILYEAFITRDKFSALSQTRQLTVPIKIERANVTLTMGSTSSLFAGAKGEVPQHFTVKIPQKLVNRNYFMVKKKNHN